MAFPWSILSEPAVPRRISSFAAVSLRRAAEGLPGSTPECQHHDPHGGHEVTPHFAQATPPLVPRMNARSSGATT